MVEWEGGEKLKRFEEVREKERREKNETVSGDEDIK